MSLECRGLWASGWEGGQGAAGPGYALLQQEHGLSGGHCSSKGKPAQPLQRVAQGSYCRGRTPRQFHSDLSYHTWTTFGRVIPAGGLTPNTPRWKMWSRLWGGGTFLFVLEALLSTGLRAAGQRAQWVTPWDTRNCGNASVGWGKG